MRQTLFSILFSAMYGTSWAQQDVVISMGKGIFLCSNQTKNEILFSPGYMNTTTQYFSAAGNDTSKKMPIPRIIWPVVNDVSSFGFNDNYILVISKTKTGPVYWVMDKSQEPESKGMTTDESRMMLSNLSHVDEATFLRLKKSSHIKLRSVENL